MTSEMTIDGSIGVALSSGGAAGLAHIGVLEELRNAGLRIDCVAGTSAGAIVGAAFAANRLDEFRDHISTLNRRRRMALFDLNWSRSSIFSGNRAMEFLRPYVGTVIEELAVPYAAVATDLRSGTGIVLTKGDVLEAIRASSAIPGFFKPFRTSDQLLVDGALADPLPVGPARQLGADFVIAVNVIPHMRMNRPRRRRQPVGALRLLCSLLNRMSSRDLENEADSIIEAVVNSDPGDGFSDVLSCASSVIQANLAAARLRDHPANFMICPDVADIGVFDLNRATAAIEAGRSAARAALPDLLESLSEYRESQSATWSRWWSKPGREFRPSLAGPSVPVLDARPYVPAQPVA